MKEFIFPHLEHSINDFLYDEEGNIPRNKVLAVGSMLIILGILLADDAFAAHRSHRSHRSHSSHRSSNGGHGSHTSHTSHGSAQTHNSHSSSTTRVIPETTPHSNHANHVTHNNVPPKLSEVDALKAPNTEPGAELDVSEIQRIFAPENVTRGGGNSEVSLSSIPGTPTVD